MSCRNLAIKIEQCGSAELVEFPGLTFRQQHILTGVEKYLGLEHEAIAGQCANVGPIAKNRSQPPKESGAVARQPCNALRERNIQPLAEISDMRLRFLIALFRGIECILERGELPAAAH